MKILFVSDCHHFSTLDMFEGYVNAAKSLGIDYEVAELHDLVNPSHYTHFSNEAAIGLILAKLLNKDMGITHCLVISGLAVPTWFFKSKYDKKIGVIASDDPHASKALEQSKEYIDYWFTNEKKFVGDDIYYIPTATSNILPVISKEDLPDKFKSDILFVGTVYDNRIGVLEDICEYAEENNLNVKIFGPLLRTPSDSIIRKYAVEGILKNNETKLLYRGSNLCINIDRDVKWSCVSSDNNPLLVDVGEPYSTNPRAYEIAGCRALQLYVNARQEVFDIFGGNVIYSGYDNLKEVLHEVSNMKDEVKLNMINNCYNIVVKDHTYVNRLKKIISIMEEKDGD